MAPLLDDYIIRMKNLHSRYSLPSSVMTLFKALGEQQRGHDPDALGRLMRMSPGMHKACTDTISQMAMVMQKNQDLSTIAECTELIKSCTEMLALANAPPAERHFSLMRLPYETRCRVYDQYFQGLFVDDRFGTVIAAKYTRSCDCLPLEGRLHASKHRKLDLKLAFTSKRMKDEVLAAFVQSHTFHFACGCELKQHLSRSAILGDNLKSLKLNWAGPQSDVGFRLLQQVGTLRRLTLVVSKATSNHPSKREKEVRKYFRVNGKNGQLRLADTLGFDELLELRGLDEVKVEHISKAQAYQRTNEDRHSLELCLKDRITHEG